MRRISVIASFVLLLAGTANAQTTPWGDPDLQGVWSNQTPVPLERPAALANKPVFTKQEAADLERNALPQLLKSVAGAIPTSGEFNEIWLETQNGKVSRGLGTALVVDPPDGRIPYTKEGRARWDSSPNVERQRGIGKPLGADRVEDRSEIERCALIEVESIAASLVQMPVCPVSALKMPVQTPCRLQRLKRL